MKRSFHPVAVSESFEAIDYYETSEPRLGHAFSAEIQRAIGNVLGHPHAWRRLSENVRRCLVKRIYLSILLIAPPGVFDRLHRNLTQEPP